MKYIVKFLTISVLVFTLNACSEEELLDLSPINQISLEDAFSSPSLIQSSVNGMYNAAAIGQYNSTSPNGGRGYVWGAAFVQQNDCRGEDMVNKATFYQLTYTNTYDPSTANNVYYWVDGYRLINRCNLVIEGVTTAVANGIISAAVGDDYIGQAKFLRAITHFELLIQFARPYHLDNGASPGIPYREIGIDTQTEIDSESLKPRNTVAEVYAKVLSDLTSAESLITNTALVKANKKAAIAFKTRVNLHKRDWDNVILEGVKLNGAYTLMSTPNGVFANNYSNTESIFSLRHDANSNPGVNAALASQYNNRSLVCISPIIWRDPSWLVDDKRREQDVMVKTVSGVIYTRKYKDVVSFSDAAPIIRYAEVVLNMAEAQARKTTPDLPTAISLLNSLRNRALADPSTQAYTSTTLPDQSTVVGAILKERRIEFLAEGRRWGDIHRLQGDNLFPISGIPQKVANGAPSAASYTLGTPYTGPYGVATIPYTDFRFIWPIPQIELNANPNIVPNPGY